MNITEKEQMAKTEKTQLAENMRETVASMNEPQPVGALNRKQAARYLGVCIRQLGYLAKAGQLRRHYIGRTPVFRIKDLEAFLDSTLVA